MCRFLTLALEIDAKLTATHERFRTRKHTLDGIYDPVSLGQFFPSKRKTFAQHERHLLVRCDPAVARLLKVPERTIVLG